MGIAFLFLAFGYIVLVQQFFVLDAVQFECIGDLIRMVGLLVLLLAVVGS
jgi:hypothetical protein